MSYPMPLLDESSSLPYDQWCSLLKIELKEKSKINVEQRLTKIEEIVNTILSQRVQRPREEEDSFSITNDAKLTIFAEINAKIDSWRGVEIDLTKNKEKKNFSSYQSTARNWFNRNKAKIYGNHLFYEIVFNHTLKFCSELSELMDRERMILFIEIFEAIMFEPVQFPRTKLQPLLPHQALMQPNRFKKACERFALYYDLKWERSSRDNKPDRGRAKKIHESFMNCLTQIKNAITNDSRPINIPAPFDSIMNETTITPTCTMTSIALDLPQEELKISRDWSHTTDNSDDIRIPPSYEPLPCVPPSYEPCMNPFECHQEHEMIHAPHYNHSFTAFPFPAPLHTHAMPPIPSYHASHVPSSNGYSVSDTRYSPFYHPDPRSHEPDTWAHGTHDHEYHSTSANNVTCGDDVDDHWNQNCHFNDHCTLYDDDDFVFTNLSHNTQSPAPVFGGFL